MILVVLIIIMIPVVLHSLMNPWSPSFFDDDGWEFVVTLQLDAQLETNGRDTATLEIIHRGGPAVFWDEYTIMLNGTTVSTGDTTVSVGEVSEFTLEVDGATMIRAGERYTARVIEEETRTIVWEDILTAKST